LPLVGKEAKALGSADLKLLQEYNFASSLRCKEKNLSMILLSKEHVRKVLFSKANTGYFVLPSAFANDLRLIKASMGQQLWKENLKREMYSPPSVLVLGILL